MNNILNYVLGGLLVLSLIFGGIFWVDNNSLEKQVFTLNSSITTLSVQRDALQASNEELKGGIESQNSSLKKLGDIQTSVNALFTSFSNSVAKTNKQIASVKDVISKEKPPATCADTIQYLKDARKEFK